MDGLDVHGEGGLAEVGHAASPLSGTRGFCRVTASPDTNSQVHGSLGESGSALGLRSMKGSEHIAVNRPGDVVLLPVDGVGVEGADGIIDMGISRPVIGGGVTLAEVVGLDFIILATESLLCPVSVWSPQLQRKGQHTQSISSRSSDSMTILLTMPVPGAILMTTSALPKKKFHGVWMVGESPCPLMVNSAPLGPVLTVPAVIFHWSKAD